MKQFRSQMIFGACLQTLALIVTIQQHAPAPVIFVTGVVLGVSIYTLLTWRNE